MRACVDSAVHPSGVPWGFLTSLAPVPSIRRSSPQRVQPTRNCRHIQMIVETGAKPAGGISYSGLSNPNGVLIITHYVNYVAECPTNRH